ncbi:MAG: DUF6356 family protein [bacterium]|jgi:hypothetical protein
MNPFTSHPHRQGFSYLEHWCFAMGVAWRLLSAAAAFALHAMLPFISISPRLDLEASAAYLAERNRWIEAVHRRARVQAQPQAAVVGRAHALGS